MAEEDPLDVFLTSAPSELVHIIQTLTIRSLTQRKEPLFAATGSAALRAVLEERKDLRSFSIHHALARAVSRMPPFTSPPRCMAQIAPSSYGYGSFVVLPWPEARLACIEEIRFDRSVQLLHFSLSQRVFGAAVEVHIAHGIRQ